MESNDESGFFDKLGEILNAPLPGTKREQPGPAGTEEDDESMLERVKDILQHTLPGTAAAGQEPTTAESVPAGQSTSGTAGAPVTDAAVAEETVPDPDAMEENWWDHEWDAFRTHQDGERNGFNLKQRRDQETFARYQEQEKMRFDAHQKQEFEGFRRQQQWKLDGWKQRVEQQAAGQAHVQGRMPPPSPWAAMPPGAFPGGFPPHPGMRPPPPRGRRR